MYRIPLVFYKTGTCRVVHEVISAALSNLVLAVEGMIKMEALRRSGIDWACGTWFEAISFLA